MSPVASLGAPRNQTHGFLFRSGSASFKDAGTMGESTNNRPGRRRVPQAAAKPARARTHLMTPKQPG